jgi:sugar O-acyltransferase (sialic acid O-acetyltransferase NeuD family)
MRPRVIVWGAQGHAAVVADILRAEGRFDVHGFLDDVAPERAGSIFCERPVLGTREVLPGLVASGVTCVVIAVGDCRARLELADAARGAGLELVTAVHPGSVVAPDATIGAGTVVAAGAVVNPRATIGENVIVNTCASVDHDCVLAAGVHLAPGAHLGGYVKVGRGSLVGLGASVIDRISIGEEAIIGAGAVVVDDIPSRAVAWGVPARPRRQVEP